MCPCCAQGQTEADTAATSKLGMDHAEQSPGVGLERSEMAGRAHSSFPYSENSVTGEYHYKGMHHLEEGGGVK